MSATRCGATLPASTACHTAQPGSRSWRQSRKRQCAKQRTDLDERLLDGLGIDMREAEHLESGRIDDPAAAFALRAADRAWTATSCAGRSDSASEIVAVFACACGAMAFRIVVLPIPDWPMRTVRSPREQRQRAATRRVAPRAERRRSPSAAKGSRRARNAAKPGWSDLFAASTKRQRCASAPMIQRLTSSSSTAMSGATTPMTCVTLAAISFSRNSSER